MKFTEIRKFREFNDNQIFDHLLIDYAEDSVDPEQLGTPRKE